MWLLPTRNRPAMCQRTLDACKAMGMTALGLVFVDGGDVESYAALRLPSNWELHISVERVRLTGSMQYALERYHNEARYGWLADDNIPKTPQFDERLEDAAGNWGFAHANDELISLKPSATRCLERCHVMTSGLCWGGNLVRAVGWWGWPEVRHVVIDAAWCHIIQALDCCRYLPDVVVEHERWTSGKRSRDATDVTAEDDDPEVRADMALYNRFVASTEPIRIARRVRAKMLAELDARLAFMEISR